ncbi:hypothetical protein OHQ89_24245 [Streptomyces canus]
MGERGETAARERTTGVRAVQGLSVEVEDDLDPSGSLLVLGGSRHRVGCVLHQLQKRAVRVTADPDGFLLVGVLRDQVRIRTIRIDRPLEEGVDLANQPPVGDPLGPLHRHDCTALAADTAMLPCQTCTYVAPETSITMFIDDVSRATSSTCHGL